MNPSESSEARFAALLEIADSQYFAWHISELAPERERRLHELQGLKLTSAGRALRAIQINQEQLVRAVRKRIGLYAEVARQHATVEMLSKPRLDQFRSRIMNTINVCILALKDHVHRDNVVAGDVPTSALPTENHYIQLETEILTIVNAELSAMEAEGKLARVSQTEAKQVAVEVPTNGELVRVRKRVRKNDSPSTARDDSAARGKAERAKARRKVVKPLLDAKGWSIQEWATNSNVDFHTANDYWNGDTNPYPSSRKKLAESLGLQPSELPE
jgi:hypothetical protein